MAERVWSALSLSILALLESREAIHGYAVVRQTGIEPTAAYKILKRFVAWKLATSTPEVPQLLRPGEKADPQRVFYAITDAGRTQLVLLRSLIARRAA